MQRRLWPKKDDRDAREERKSGKGRTRRGWERGRGADEEVRIGRMRGEGLGRDEGEPPRRVSEFAALNMVDSRIGCAVAGRYGPHHRPADCTRYCIPTILRHVLFSLSSPPPLALSLSLSPSLPPSRTTVFIRCYRRLEAVAGFMKRSKNWW